MTAWGDITDAIALAQRGDRAEGCAALMACWDATTEADHAKRCILAHYLADLQSLLEDEAAWDEVALSEHASVVDKDLVSLGVPSAAALAPSLHLNLGDGYLRLGRVDDAKAQLSAGWKAATTLPMDGYGGHIRSGLGRLEQRIEDAQRPTEPIS